jgi:hypothetical protein
MIFVLSQSVCKNRLEKLVRDKHSSLLCKLVNYGQKSLITFAPYVALPSQNTSLDINVPFTICYFQSLFPIQIATKDVSFPYLSLERHIFMLYKSEHTEGCSIKPDKATLKVTNLMQLRRLFSVLNFFWRRKYNIVH